MVNVNDEKIFLTREIDIDVKIEEIFRNIEAHILKEALSAFAQTEDEIKGLDKFIEKTNDLMAIYAKEQRDIITNQAELRKEGADEYSIKTILEDINKILNDLNQYRRLLSAMKEDVSSEKITLKKEATQIKEIFESMKKAYSDYITKNEQIIKILIQTRTRLKSAA